MGQENHGSQLLPALLWSTGFNSGFGLKDTWLSSLPRLQVGKGQEGTSLTCCPVPPPFLKVSASPSSLCSTALGAAHGSSCPSLRLP